MSGDFSPWNNSPSTHIAPDSIADIYRREERKRDRRKHVFFITLIIVGTVLAAWAVISF